MAQLGEGRGNAERFAAGHAEMTANDFDGPVGQPAEIVLDPQERRQQVRAPSREAPDALDQILMPRRRLCRLLRRAQTTTAPGHYSGSSLVHLPSVSGDRFARRSTLAGPPPG